MTVELSPVELVVVIGFGVALLVVTVLDLASSRDSRKRWKT